MYALMLARLHVVVQSPANKTQWNGTCAVLARLTKTKINTGSISKKERVGNVEKDAVKSAERGKDYEEVALYKVS